MAMTQAGRSKSIQCLTSSARPRDRRNSFDRPAWLKIRSVWGITKREQLLPSGALLASSLIAPSGNGPSCHADVDSAHFVCSPIADGQDRDVLDPETPSGQN
ncbi:hypothetical protein BJF96_g2514 [Verticillium dahliae]|uniref:Uncharacterized protein n=1 Tax=Verticillium dahliae TaxID=27337 RepID=A0AA44WQY9_VERDA|nr:hypothetical protein BJF96_g2514 [Verticillium dahliae]